MHVYTFHQVEGPNKFLFRNCRHIVKGRANPLQVISSYEGDAVQNGFLSREKVLALGNRGSDLHFSSY
jgi:hypothetical protein